MKRPLQLPLAIALALGATNVLALGLGPVHVKSKLNQPLDAEIPVIEGNTHDADGLLVSLAGADDFERVGLSRSRLSVPLEFTVVKGAQGGLVIKVTSKEPVRSTYLDFLVEANWTKGRLLREYTVLLDPPVTAPATRSATTAALAESPGTVTIAATHTKPADHAVAAATLVSEPTPRATAKPAREASKVSNGEYGPVGAGETLSGVARATRAGTGANLDQMMLALLKNNPNAFYKDNINALKRGAILRVPSADAIKAVGSASDAAAQVHAQVEDWRGGRATPTLVADAGSKSPAPSPVASTKSVKASAAASKTAGERLELVPPKLGNDSLAVANKPGNGAGSAAATSELKSELARTKESLTTREQESGELKSKVKELEDLNGKNDRLISLKNSEIADLQRKLKQLQEKSDTTPVKSSPATPTPAPAPAPAKAVESAPLAATSVAPAVAPLAAATKPAETVKPDKQADKKDIWGGANGASAAATPPAAGKSVEAKAPATMTPPPAAASGPVSASVPLAQSPPTTVTPHSAITETMPAAPAAAKVVPKPAQPAVVKPAPIVAAPWYEQPWVKPAALGAGVLLLLAGLLGLRKRKVAPVAGRGSIADAFGDSPLPSDGSATTSDAVEAEEADLREQLHHDPANVGLHVELLSLYYAERDVAKFEDQAAEMHEHVVDLHQPEWLEAQAMGQELAPDNPLFAGAAHYDGIDAATATAHTDTLESHAFEDHATLDAGHDIHAATPDYDTAHLDEDRVFEPDHTESTYVQTGMPVHTQSPADEHAFTFDDLPPLVPVPMHETTTAAEASATAAAAPMARIDEDDFAGEEAIGTKLDLAKAYMDMGDPEGARSMLEEVVAEGTDAQKAEAHRLMADIR
jgi:pilus assembly protein FimV